MADWNFFEPAQTDPNKMSIGELFQTCGECEGPLHDDGSCRHCRYRPEYTVDQVESRRKWLIEHPDER